MARAVDLGGIFGSLDNATAPPELRPDRLLLARNLLRIQPKAVTKRPGLRILAGVAAYPENAVAPVLTDLGATAGSTLGNGTLYVRITYATSAGETDDLHSTQASIPTTAGIGVSVRFPFHIFNARVQSHEMASTALVLNDTFNAAWLTGLADSAFNGYYVYARDPTIQDETGLGVNPHFRKLWDRTNHVAKVSTYTATGFSFALSQALPFSLKDKRIDIRMPDINGHAVRAANIYVSTNGTDFYLFESYAPAAESTDVHPGLVTITGVPTSNRRAPSTRITRTAPTVIEADANDTDPESAIAIPMRTGLTGGVYLLRYCWETEDATYLDNGGWPEATSFGLCPRSRRASQFAWPSKAALVAVSDDKGISLTLPALPAGCERAHVYAKRLAPSETLTFVGINNPSVTHRAYGMPNLPGVGNTTNSTQAILDGTWRPMTPSAFRAYAQTGEYYSTAAGSTMNYDAIESVNGTLARSPSYPTYDYSLAAFTKSQFEFNLTAGQKANSTFMCLVIRFKPTPNSAFGMPSGTVVNATGQPPYCAVRRWNDGGAAWTSFTPEDAFSARSIVDMTNVTHRFAFAWTSTMAEGNRAVFDVYGVNGLEPWIDYVALELYTDSVATDPSVTADETRQDPPGVKVTTAFTIKTTLVTPAEGDPIHANTTGQAPIGLYAAAVKRYDGGNGADSLDDFQLMAAAADSVFIERDGDLVRVYSQDRDDGCNAISSVKALRADWWFTNLWNRVFFGHPENDLTYNLRFDGVQTHGMGLADPRPDGSTPIDDDGGDTPEPEPIDNPDPYGCARFNVKEQWIFFDQDNGAAWFTDDNEFGGRNSGFFPINCAKYPRWVVYDPEGGRHEIYDYRRLNSRDEGRAEDYGVADKIGQVFEATAVGRNESGSTRITPVTTTYTDDIIHCLRGDPPPEPEPLPDDPDVHALDPGEYNYLILYLRKFEGAGTEGRGYIVQSKPITLATVTLDEGEGRVQLYVPAPDDPQVTHVQAYRSLRGTTDYFLVAEAEVTPGALNESGDLVLIDDTPDDDAQLAAFLNRFTGRPPVSSHMAWHRRRAWMVPFFNKGSVSFSNLTSFSGAIDPEGVYAYNNIVPALLKQGSITALAPYRDEVLCHSDHGIVALTGLSDDLSSGNQIGSGALFSGAGAIGTKAWCNRDTVQFFTSREGIHVIRGGEVTSIAALVKGTIRSMKRADAAAAFMRCSHFRQDGASVMLFSYSDRTDGRPDRALTYDLNVGAGEEEERRLWADWTDLYAHDIELAEAADGTERTYIGDHWGRVHEMSTQHRTDNGLFIDADIVGAPLSLSGPGESFQLSQLVLSCAGRAGDFLRMDYYKDLSGQAYNERPIRISLPGTGNAQWNPAQHDWGVSNTPGTWGGASGTGWDEKPVHLRGIFRQVSFRFSQRFADMPPGVRRDASFAISRYKVWLDDKGLRRQWPR